MARRDKQQTVKRTPDAARLPATGSELPPGARTTVDDDVPESVPGSAAPEPSGDAHSGLGRYQLLFELARGGMGTVHVGRLRGAHGFDRLVAIKLLRSDPGSSGDLESFLAEARVTAGISHPNIVQTLELGEHDGRPFIVMELIQGASLARLLQRLARAGHRLEPHLLMWMMSRVATGLHAAHDAAVIHRDVSPENVLLSFEGRVYVADFGVAKLTSAGKQTESGVVKGKFAYMSPEQTEGRDLDRRSDVFALGIVMHESLTGASLFSGNSIADTIRRIWAVAPPNPCLGRPDVPAALGELTLRCLEKDRDRRPASAGDVALELRRILRSEGAVVDEEDVGALVRHYFKHEPEKLKRRIEEAIRSADGTGPSPAASASLKVGPMALEPAQESVMASVATGPPLTPRRYAGAWMALGAAVLVAGGVFAARAYGDRGGEVGPLQEPERAPAAPSTGAPSTATPAPAPAPPPAPEATESAEPSSTQPDPAPAPSDQPPRPPRSSKSHSPLPELAPKLQPPSPASSGSPRGKPIDVFDE
jgi:serine/threonine-protein kinase